MRIAVLADIHGNLPALEAVLRDVEEARVDLVVLNGDLADGPCPAETLARLQNLGDAWLGLRGNGDRWLVEACEGRFRPRGKAVDDLIRWAAGRITPAQRDLLAALPLTRIIEHPILGRIGFCHASARSDNEMVLVESSIEHAREALCGIDAPTIFIGHSHMPFDRLFDRRRVVNSGSVGMPYGHEGASWALIDKDIALRRTAYDRDAAIARMATSSMPDIEGFLRNYVRTTYGDAEALEAFRATMTTQRDTGQFD